MADIEISKQTARRFILGRQGLWPGRRWQGLEGAAQAIRSMEALQIDPLNVVARSHDITLYGRVVGYKPEYLNSLLYEQRQFFDYGGGLHIYPIEEMPYWRLPMRHRAEHGRWAQLAAEQPELVDEARNALRTRGPLGNRDLPGNARVTGNYRGRKDTALALYYLWLTGEVMIHHRNGFDRMYDFRENVVPSEYDWAATPEQSEAYFARKAVRYQGLVTERSWRNYLSNFFERNLDAQEGKSRLAAFMETGELASLHIEGSKDTWYALASDLPLLDTLEAGEIPAAWQPLAETTLEEAVILAPLEIVSARGRAKWLFDFDYVWEVYKPAEQRRWGYYTLPVLYGDQLVARLDPKLERKSGTLLINGYWPEEPGPASTPQFEAAFARGLARFAQFAGARQVEIRALQPESLRAEIRRQVGESAALTVIE